MCRWWRLAHHHSTGPHVPCCSEGCWQRLPAAASCRSTLLQQARCIACCCLPCRQRGAQDASAVPVSMPKHDESLCRLVPKLQVQMCLSGLHVTV